MSKRDREKKQIRYSDTKKVVESHDSGYVSGCFKLPEGMETFRFKRAGKYVIDIIPYVVGKGNPHCDEGMVHYERTYWSHKNVGPENKAYCCLSKTFKKKCFICEELARLRKEGTVSDDELKEMAPKERQMFLFVDTSDRDRKLMLYEGSHYRGFGELLYAKLEAADDDSPFLNFFHLEDGMSLHITVREEKWMGRAFYKPSNIEMVPRKKQYDDTMLDDAPCLDDLLIEMDYNKLKAIFTQDSSSDEEEEEKVPVRKSSKIKEEEPEEDEDDNEEEPEEEEEEPEEEGISLGDTVRHKKHGVCTVVKISTDRKTVTLEKEEDGTILQKIPIDMVSPVEEEEEDPKPTKKGGSTSSKITTSTEDDDDDNDLDPDEDLVDDEEEPPAKPAKKGKK